MIELFEAAIERAAFAIARADALLIGAGAGMGVDSGLPDFRGKEGFWKAYPPFRGRPYEEICGPHLMENDPAQAWGFYGHCLKLYGSAEPHKGFRALRRWGEKKSGGYFVFTSNVDGHFIRTGFEPENILEVHGTFHYMQCGRGLKCGPDLWESGDLEIEVDESTLRAVSELPVCIKCGAIARPNILMFGDRAWNPLRTAGQENHFEDWLKERQGANIVAIEIGAGNVIPTVRYECRRHSKKLIRINPREFEAPPDAISVPLSALEALLGIDKILV